MKIHAYALAAIAALSLSSTVQAQGTTPADPKWLDDVSVSPVCPIITVHWAPGISDLSKADNEAEANIAIGPCVGLADAAAHGRKNVWVVLVCDEDTLSHPQWKRAPLSLSRCVEVSNLLAKMDIPKDHIEIHPFSKQKEGKRDVEVGIFAGPPHRFQLTQAQADGIADGKKAAAAIPAITERLDTHKKWLVEDRQDIEALKARPVVPDLTADVQALQKQVADHERVLNDPNSGVVARLNALEQLMKLLKSRQARFLLGAGCFGGHFSANSGPLGFGCHASAGGELFLGPVLTAARFQFGTVGISYWGLEGTAGWESPNRFISISGGLGYFHLGSEDVEVQNVGSTTYDRQPYVKAAFGLARVRVKIIGPLHGYVEGKYGTSRSKVGGTYTTPTFMAGEGGLELAF